MGNLCFNSNTNTTRREWIFPGLGQTAKAVTTVLALVLVLVLGAFAASPTLHQRIQTDRNHSGHFCVICALATGQLDVVENTPLVAAACVFLVSGVLATETSLVSLFDFSFSPSRAPPRF